MYGPSHKRREFERSTEFAMTSKNYSTWSGCLGGFFDSGTDLESFDSITHHSGHDLTTYKLYMLWNYLVLVGAPHLQAALRSDWILNMMLRCRDGTHELL